MTQTEHAKTSDPTTSHEAAEAIAPKIGKLVRWALRVYHKHEGSTTGEIAAIEGDGQTWLYDFRRRISDAKKRGYLDVYDSRECGQSGKSCETYRLTKTGLAIIEGCSGSLERPASKKQKTWVTSIMMQKVEDGQLAFKLVMSRTECNNEEQAAGRAVNYWTQELPGYTVAQTLTIES